MSEEETRYDKISEIPFEELSNKPSFVVHCDLSNSGELKSFFVKLEKDTTLNLETKKTIIDKINSTRQCKEKFNEEIVDLIKKINEQTTEHKSISNPFVQAQTKRLKKAAQAVINVNSAVKGMQQHIAQIENVENSIDVKFNKEQAKLIAAEQKRKQEEEKVKASVEARRQKIIKEFRESLKAKNDKRSNPVNTVVKTNNGGGKTHAQNIAQWAAEETASTTTATATTTSPKSPREVVFKGIGEGEFGNITEETVTLVDINDHEHFDSYKTCLSSCKWNMKYKTKSGTKTIGEEYFRALIQTGFKEGKVPIKKISDIDLLKVQEPSDINDGKSLNICVQDFSQEYCVELTLHKSELTPKGNQMYEFLKLNKDNFSVLTGGSFDGKISSISGPLTDFLIKFKTNDGGKIIMSSNSDRVDMARKVIHLEKTLNPEMDYAPLIVGTFKLPSQESAPPSIMLMGENLRVLPAQGMVRDAQGDEYGFEVESNFEFDDDYVDPFYKDDSSDNNHKYILFKELPKEKRTDPEKATLYIFGHDINKKIQEQIHENSKKVAAQLKHDVVLENARKMLNEKQNLTFVADTEAIRAAVTEKSESSLFLIARRNAAHVSKMEAEKLQYELKHKHAKGRALVEKERRAAEYLVEQTKINADAIQKYNHEELVKYQKGLEALKQKHDTMLNKILESKNTQARLVLSQQLVAEKLSTTQDYVSSITKHNEQLIKDMELLSKESSDQYQEKILDLKTLNSQLESQLNSATIELKDIMENVKQSITKIEAKIKGMDEGTREIITDMQKVTDHAEQVKDYHDSFIKECGEKFDQLLKNLESTTSIASETVESLGKAEGSKKIDEILSSIDSFKPLNTTFENKSDVISAASVARGRAASRGGARKGKSMKHTKKSSKKTKKRETSSKKTRRKKSKSGTKSTKHTKRKK
jgi:hypothetical protein